MVRILSIRLRKLLHDSFVIGLILKGLNGLAELVGAAIILFVTPEEVRSFIRALTLHELTEDPNDLLAIALLHMAKSFSVGTQVFAVLYLAVHGAVKLFLIVMLLRRKYWAYPVAVGVFTIFYYLSGIPVYNYALDRPGVTVGCRYDCNRIDNY